MWIVFEKIIIKVSAISYLEMGVSYIKAKPGKSLEQLFLTSIARHKTSKY